MAIKSEFVCEEKPTFGRDCEIIWSTVKIGNCKTLSRIKSQLASLKNWPHLLHLGLVLYSNIHMTQVQYPQTGLKPWLQLFIKKNQSQTLLIIALSLLLPYVVRLWNISS